MPRILINVNEAWLKRYNDVLPAAIDTLLGWQAQLQNHVINGEQEAEDLLEALNSQIHDLRRNLESLRMMF